MGSPIWVLPARFGSSSTKKLTAFSSSLKSHVAAIDVPNRPNAPFAETWRAAARTGWSHCRHRLADSNDKGVTGFVLFIGGPPALRAMIVNSFGTQSVATDIT